MEVQSFDELRPIIERVYTRGMNGLQSSLESGEIDDFHEWRKRVKYLRYQIDILNRLWPQVCKVLEDELHDITDLTGSFHDLPNLQVTVQDLDQPFSNNEERILFHSIIDKQIAYLKKHVLLKGRKFYSDTTDVFCDRFEVYWKTHREEIMSEKLPQTKHLEYS